MSNFFIQFNSIQVKRSISAIISNSDWKPCTIILHCSSPPQTPKGRKLRLFISSSPRQKSNDDRENGISPSWWHSSSDLIRQSGGNRCTHLHSEMHWGSRHKTFDDLVIEESAAVKPPKASSLLNQCYLQSFLLMDFSMLDFTSECEAQIANNR